jgi:transcriptional regulator with XRE-family HTH domain
MKTETQHESGAKPQSTLAARLDELMKLNHWSRTEMARIAGVSPTSVTNWFKRETISKESAAKLARPLKPRSHGYLQEQRNSAGHTPKTKLHLLKFSANCPYREAQHAGCIPDAATKTQRFLL